MDSEKEDAFTTDIVDVSGISIKDIDGNNSAIAKAILRIKSELENPQDAVAGFQSAPQR